MKVENRILYLDNVDLDHVLGELELIDVFTRPPSELFLKGLQIELELNGLNFNMFDSIKIKKIWE